MKEFLKLGTDPCDVIRLFPDLLPQQTGALEFPETSRDLTEKELETGLLALIDFLTEMRFRLQAKPKVTHSKICLLRIVNEFYCRLTLTLREI